MSSCHGMSSCHDTSSCYDIPSCHATGPWHHVMTCRHLMPQSRRPDRPRSSRQMLLNSGDMLHASQPTSGIVEIPPTGMETTCIFETETSSGGYTTCLPACRIRLGTPTYETALSQRGTSERREGVHELVGANYAERGVPPDGMWCS